MSEHIEGYHRLISDRLKQRIGQVIFGKVDLSPNEIETVLRDREEALKIREDLGLPIEQLKFEQSDGPESDPPPLG